MLYTAPRFRQSNRHHMKKTLTALPLALLLGVIVFSKRPSADVAQTAAVREKHTQVSSSSSNHQILRGMERSLAAKGQLWETMEDNGRERFTVSMPVETQPFQLAASAPSGSQIRLSLSPRMPEIEATVLDRTTDEHGTTLTNLRIAGNPEGVMHVAENPGAGFFLGQIFYKKHPVAYQFTKQDGAITATRHQISDLLCSSINFQSMSLKQLGVPMGKSKGTTAARSTKATTVNTDKCVPTTMTAVSIADARINEGNAGTRALVFTLSLNRASKTPVTVSYATSDITATAGSDYTSVSGTITIPRGRRSATITVMLRGDVEWEENETFAVTLSNPVNIVIARAQAVGMLINDEVGVPLFNSNPGATAVVYLDMDGETVAGTRWNADNNGNPIVAGTMVGVISEQQMRELCIRTAEDFAPFNVNVTTDVRVFNAAPVTSRTRCIITPYVNAFNPWAEGAGGIAYLNTFSTLLDDPCWSFWYPQSSILYTADTNSHEVGHTMGLLHHGTNTPAEEYYEGHGTGEVGWQPIMGAGERNVSQWSRGEYFSASNPTQDDLAVITTRNNFTYRLDDHVDTTTGATPLTGSFNRTARGIISTRTDVDVFTYTTVGGGNSMSVRGVTGQNIDIMLELLDSNGVVLNTVNPDRGVNAIVNVNLPAGTYFLRVSGVGRGNVLGDGYSDYGSIGQYTITGTAP
jgi:hypothetical protein